MKLPADLPTELPADLPTEHPTDLPTELPTALAYSRYATATLAAFPACRDELVATLDQPFAWPEALVELDAASTDGEAVAVDVALRRLRRRLMLHTLARDLTGRANLAEVCKAVTRLAEVGIRAAVAAHHRSLAASFGEPSNAEGKTQQLVVIGMGKLGGGELNVSSDIDLVFVYPDAGETTGPRRIANSEFFDRLGRRVIASLNDRTSEGFVFRVDMRLRPYGDSGPLTVPFGALEQYLVTQGRAWERYAWLKARYLTGDRHDELDDMVRPFVYRKYLDYDAYEGLRDIHRQIREQVRRRDYQGNIKLGPGGIREIEFIAQAIQLVRGGREPSLRQRGTLPALAALDARRFLPDGAAAQLVAAYDFLRRLEHRLQYRDDEQTQSLSADTEERRAAAAAMGYPDVPAFELALAAHRAAVEEQFGAVFGESATASGSESATASAGGASGSRTERADPAGAAAPDRAHSQALEAIWRGDAAPGAAADTLAVIGYADPASLAATLERVRASQRYQQMPGLSRERFDTLVPRLLAIATREPVPGAEPQAVFTRLLGLLETVSRRSAYLALLIEHPRILPHLTRLMGGSAWAAEYLCRHPILLDELLDPRALLAEPDWEAWRHELARMLGDHAGDPELQMDALRHFQHAQAFRLLAQDLDGLLTVERLADHLSALADVIVSTTLAEVWAQMRGADAPPPRFAVIGYGKLGGKELGYVSDLDVVFLYDDAGDDGDQAPVRYVRFAQRVITWLTTNTAAGQLYDIDTRLRPDGAAGLLVLPFPAFCRYQREKAWTWEHQALTRARFVAGDATLGAAFEAERDAILRLPRDPAKLRDEVLAMRDKIHAGHPNPTPDFDLKHDPGGMVDVEFAVQYLVLAHAHEHPELTRNLGNIALLGIAGRLGLLPTDLAAAAADAYRDYRRLQHSIRLTGAPHARVDPATQAGHRAAVAALTRRVLGTETSDAS